ncbi:dehydrogenase/reductase SDR family member on chromosome X [Ictalurus punctatus]|uniref:Dehydrogenase/reductase SDR family member on chromosome X n=1 Tax=Ictalurus punctatus TaxID=7998 RepID=A0A2D0R6K6_ICTPU|nr:dehydrogenase/reductase SDR family member on chromosome X [Ictalurus punctatus]
MAILSRIISALKLYLVGVKLLLYQLIHRPFISPVLPEQHGKVAIVTGGTRGIGYEIVKRLLNLGMQVIIASRDQQQGLVAVERLRKESSEAQVDFELLDLASQSSVREFVRRFKERKLPLHVLINNAAVMLVPEEKTDDGFELHFSVNYLGHFLLTRLLLDTLARSGTEECSRVISICSSAHYVSDRNLRDFRSLQDYSSHASYTRSKLAQLLFTYHLHQELQTAGYAVTVNAVDPGMVDTELYRHMSFPVKLAQKLIACLLFRTPAQAAETAVYTAASQDFEGVSGCYVHEGRPVKSSPASYDAKLQAELWENTCRLLRLPVKDVREL